MLVRKSLSLSDAQIKADAEGIFEGYASVFGGVDSYGDTIQRGAFESTLRNYGRPMMFLNHNLDALPIGAWTHAKEDDHGLYVKGQLTPGMSVASDVLAALKHGTLTGLSIGFYLKGNDFEYLDNGGRLIKRVSRLVEVSAVTFPADDAARIDLESVKSEWGDALEGVETMRDFERLLRDAAGCSKGLAAALTSRAKAILGQRDAAATDADAKAAESVAAELLAGCGVLGSRLGALTIPR